MREKLMLLLACFIFAVGTVTAQTSNVTGTVISEEDGQPVVGRFCCGCWYTVGYCN